MYLFDFLKRKGSSWIRLHSSHKHCLWIKLCFSFHFSSFLLGLTSPIWLVIVDSKVERHQKCANWPLTFAWSWCALAGFKLQRLALSSEKIWFYTVPSLIAGALNGWQQGWIVIGWPEEPLLGGCGVAAVGHGHSRKQTIYPLLRGATEKSGHKGLLPTAQR